MEAAANADLSAYPDRHCLELRETLAARPGVDINSILVGNGTVQLIHLQAGGVGGGMHHHRPGGLAREVPSNLQRQCSP